MSRTTPPVAIEIGLAPGGEIAADAAQGRGRARGAGAFAGDEAVVGRGDDLQRRHTRGLPAFQAVAVLDRERAAGVARGFGDMQAMECAAEPIHGVGREQQALELVVRDRLILERVAARVEAEGAEHGEERRDGPDPATHAQPRYRFVMGMRRSRPNARVVTLIPGGA